MSSRISVSILADLATKISAETFLGLVERVSCLLAAEKGTVGALQIAGRLIEVPSVGEAVVVGDLHGDLESLVHVLEESRFLAKMRKGEPVLLVFLGDYGDRGAKSAEVYYIVLALKEMFPETVILMRGNHEGPPDIHFSPHDLPFHLEKRFGDKGTAAYLRLRNLFSHLYTGVLIEDRCVLLHGGVPSQATTIEDIAFAHKRHPRERHLEEILWSDPLAGIKGTIGSPRGAGRLFGEDVTNRLLKMLNVKVLIRGHQPCPDGYKADHSNKVLTLFSRKGAPYGNSCGAYLHLDLSRELKTPKQFLKGVHKF